MQKTLKDYFPLIRESESILAEINSNKSLSKTFNSWPTDFQNDFLDICTGTKGIKITYDSFFKEIFNAEYNAPVLNAFISALLGQKVKVLHVLPNDGTRMADEESLLITDIVVELEDGSIANIEIQKIGYLFPGERAACYSSDLLLRQYKRLRDKRKKNFKYSEMRPVYTIILFEHSPEEFHKHPHEYIHIAETKTNTGANVNLLQKFIFVPLDIFKKLRKNKNTENTLDAWLSFLITDAPEDIIKLIEKHPEFIPLYNVVYEMCRNMEDAMGLFSEELRIMDRNTVRFMIDEMQKELDEKTAALKDINAQLVNKDAALADKDAALADKDAQLAEKDALIAKLMANQK